MGVGKERILLCVGDWGVCVHGGEKALGCMNDSEHAMLTLNLKKTKHFGYLDL